MATVKCDKCGKEVIIDETRSFGFCSFCGAKINCNQTTLNNPFDNSINSNGSVSCHPHCCFILYSSTDAPPCLHTLYPDARN